MSYSSPNSLRASSRIVEIDRADESTLTRYLNRAEGMIRRFGEYNTLKEGFVTDMETATNLLAEKLFIIESPQARQAREAGVAEYTIGDVTYSFKELSEPLSGEVLDILTHYRLNEKTGMFGVIRDNTVVF